MGVINVTPDSFFPGSRAETVEAAVARGREMFAAGADVVDVGGESTRPRAASVSPDEELARVVPVVRTLSLDGPISIDTQKPDVARACVDAGATIVNDVSGSLADVAGALGVSYVAMHRRGDSATMQDDPRYDDVVADVGAYLDVVGRRARDAGVVDLWLDPGIGFGKTVAHNLSLLAHLDDLVARAAILDAGVLVGTSRKSFLRQLGDRDLGVEDRLDGSIATVAWAILQGATMVRVHDVASAVQVRDLATRSLEGVGA
jgi:dihydropteroate synthase